ncbi:BREX system ATP-binding domain-containing protein [Methanobacterium oryzae]|uniref:BREX system ATP-binding domain-containing protein n=1 Tax=Methanobacterium oryzae TaxID=69540 RepID=UPI003D19758E
MDDYEDIIHALKEGNVPPKGTSEICVGRELEIEEMKRLFEKIKGGKSATKFLEGDYGGGKSFLLKVIEEIAFKDNFVVSKVTITRDIPFYKFEEVYKNIVQTLRCKTGISLEHIIQRWITGLKMVAMEETEDSERQNEIVAENMVQDLEETRKHANSFAIAIEKYHNALIAGDIETANYAQAWLRGDSNIPFVVKKKFGVKGEVTKENAFTFLEALSAFLRSLGYSGLLILIDEVEYIRSLQMKKLRDGAYDYIRYIFDECNLGNFESTLFVFAGTSGFFEDQRKGVPSYPALYDRIKDALDTDHKDLRKPIMRLEGFKKEELKELASKIVEMHSKVYDWDAGSYVNFTIEDLVDIHENNALLTGGKTTPREFVRTFLSVLDTIQQNPKQLDSDEAILKLFEEREVEEEW